jgi:hypothetical protein
LQEIEGRHRTAVPGGNVNKLGVSTVLAVSAFCVLSWVSPLKANATSTIDLKFDGNSYDGKGGKSSGGVETYPYYFTINDAKTETPLLCVTYQDRINQGETWVADVYAIGAGTLAETGLTVAEQEEDAYLDSVVQNPTSSAATITDAQWADWEVGDPGFFKDASDTGSTNPILKGLGLTSSEITGINNEYDAAETFVDGNSLLDLSSHTLANDPSFYAGYELFAPVANSWPKGDGTPQSFIGPTIVPEPSSLILFGSGLLSAAGALYRRKRRTA